MKVESTMFNDSSSLIRVQCIKRKMGFLEYWYAIEKKHKSDSSYKYIVNVKRACDLISEEVMEISE